LQARNCITEIIVWPRKCVW